MYPLREVLFLVVCGTIASGDDYDDIVDWGKTHLAFLRGFAEFHFGIPCADRLRCVMNRIVECFSSWVAACWPDKLDLVAIDGKTSRRTYNRRTGHKALHLVSAFATNSRLVLGQEASRAASNAATRSKASPHVARKCARRAASSGSGFMLPPRYRPHGRAARARVHSCGRGNWGPPAARTQSH
jgi:hypothetical protein